MNAIAGSPCATARSQARRIVELSAVSHDQCVCTWLSGGLIGELLLPSVAPLSPVSSPVHRPRARARTVGGAAYCRRHDHRCRPRPRSPSSRRVHAEALAILRELTGRPDAEFREGQDAAVVALVERSERALVVQRTGWGKSAVYFVSTALLRRRGKGPTLLVSPLLALMRDQVAAAARAGIRAVEISSANMTEWDDIAARLAADDVDVLLVSPERLTNPRFREEQLPGLVAPLRAGRGRRGALRLRLGPRFPPRLPAHPRPAGHACPPARPCWRPPPRPTSGWWPTSPSSSGPAASG